VSRTRIPQWLLPLAVPLVIGFLAGWFTRSVVDEKTVPAGDVLVAAVTLFAAWWIQRALGAQAELDRIPMEGVAASTDRIGQLTSECLDVAQTTTPTDAILLLKLRHISNEITWLRTVSDSSRAAADELERAQSAYLSFKRALTGGATIDHAAAGRYQIALRSQCLEFRWKICKRILAMTGEESETPFNYN
jgi:hypothetical protein